MPKKTLKEILSPNIISVSPNTLVSETISIMSEKKVSCLIIIQNKKTVGIFTERDVVRCLYAGIQLEKHKIKDVMTKHIFTASPDMNLYEAYDLLQHHKIRHLVVVDSKGKLMGVVTQTDLMNNLGLEYFVEVKEVSKVMTRNVVTVGKENPVQDAIDKMSRFSISCIVIEENTFPVGILTERDLTRLFYEKGNINDLKIEEVMSHTVKTIPLHTPVYDAVKIMSQEKIRRLIIVDNAGKIAGLITQYDITKKLKGEYIDYLKNIIHEKDKLLEKTKKILTNKLVLEHIRIQKLESLGLLAGGIAHDFNNLLTSILGNISFFKISIKPEDEHLGRLTETEKIILRAKNLTHQLLTFAQGGLPVKKVISISELLKESVEFALAGSNIKCDFSIPDNLLPVECDEGQLSQVFNNLIINAKEAMPKGGIIEIKAQNLSVLPEQIIDIPEGKYIKISITDTGCGIPKKYLNKIFDPYLTTKSRKSGLGLTTTYSIVKKHYGYIDVESKSGIGTTFHIYLPASDEKITSDRKQADNIIRGKGKILLMDDEEDILRITGDILRYLGYEVETAKDGDSAIALYKKAKESNHPFDVVILDLVVPGEMGGKETIKKLIIIDHEVKAIVSSGYSNDFIMEDFRKHGFVAVMAKPFKVEELSQLVYNLINEGQLSINN
ncbi:MAG: CBS domain-containing protein [Nitrospirota bacterium]